MMPNHNNILIVMADQLTAKALGCYGNQEVKSPNIDKLANEGVMFESAYSSSPLCTPARYAFVTGQNISRFGAYDNASYLPSTIPTIAHYLRLMGYKTSVSGKMHFVGSDQLHGFETRLTTDVYPADFGWIPDWTRPDERIDLWYHNMSSVKQAGIAAITNQLSYDEEVGNTSINTIYNHARSEDERPLFLLTSFIHPHDPYAARKKYWDLYENTKISLPSVSRDEADKNDPHQKRLENVIDLDAVEITNQDIINARRAYYANVSYIDDWLGKIKETLIDCDLDQNTTIIFTSDHGDMLGEYGLWYKMSFREWSNRIPLIIHNPNYLDHRMVPQAVSQVDILPTLIDIVHNSNGTPKPEPIDPLDGRSLLPLCKGNDSEDPDICYSEYLGEGAKSPMLMIRKGYLKYISCSDDPEQLFNLKTDPDERVNCIDDTRYTSQAEEFRMLAKSHWNSDKLREKIIADQIRRCRVHEALRIGKYESWDYQPYRDASNEFTRSHLDLTKFDISSRFPRPKPFLPKKK